MSDYTDKVIPPRGINEYWDKQLKTDCGIDRTHLMLKFIPIIEAKTEKVLERSLNKLKSFLVQQLRRGISPQENLNLLEGCRNFMLSNPETNERIVAMEYLFECKFITK